MCSVSSIGNVFLGDFVQFHIVGILAIGHIVQFVCQEGIEDISVKVQLLSKHPDAEKPDCYILGDMYSIFSRNILQVLPNAALWISGLYRQTENEAILQELTVQTNSSTGLDNIAEYRTKAQTLQHIQSIQQCLTETEKKHVRNLYGITEVENALLQLDVDLHRCTPLEALHVLAVQRITNSNKLLLHTTYKCLCLRLSLQCTVESTLASPITVESTLASPITVESTLASPITVESTLASPITVESTLASPITVESTLASPITVESTLASPITVESTLASPITVESTLASPITQKVLSVIPSVGLGLHLESNKYQAALRWWLRLDTSAISHFDLHWKMDTTAEISKDVYQIVVPSNDISTLSAGGNMMTKRTKGNTRA
eukprot:Em0003g1295a